MNLSLFGFRLMSPKALKDLEGRADERWRIAHERRNAEAARRLEQLGREAEAAGEASRRRCREMEAECRRSIREQYEVFDRQWRNREDMSQARVQELRQELDSLTQSLSAYTDKGRKLLALAIDRRTPENESVAAFLKARAQGIRLV